MLRLAPNISIVVGMVGLHIILYTAPAQTAPPEAASPSSTTQQNGSPRFDVVSIRPSGGTGNWLIGVTPDEYHALHVPLWITIAKAYLPTGFQKRDLIRNAPEWIWNDKFDFIGKISETDLKQWSQLRRGFSNIGETTILQNVLQGALEDRCNIKVHRAPETVSGYSLTVEHESTLHKRLKASDPNESTPSQSVQIPGGGLMVPIVSPQNPQLNFYHSSMASLAAELTQMLSIPIEDRTGVSGVYDFALGKREGEVASPDLFDLHGLGLVLKPRKLTVDAVVIDRIDKPTIN